MKLDLKLLAIRFFQAEEGPVVPDDGVNRYLVDNVLLPAMSGKKLYPRDIDFSAFDHDDIEELEEYHERINYALRQLDEFTKPVSRTRPASRRTRTFC